MTLKEKNNESQKIINENITDKDNLMLLVKNEIEKMRIESMHIVKDAIKEIKKECNENSMRLLENAISKITETVINQRSVDLESQSSYTDFDSALIHKANSFILENPLALEVQVYQIFFNFC